MKPTADELLKAIHETRLGSISHMEDERQCQFCGFGPMNPFISTLDPKEGPHLPSCLWLQIEEYMKGIDRA